MADDPRPPPLFIAGARALDFLNSIATPIDRRVEWLNCGDDLLAWLRAAALAPPEVLSSMRRTTPATELDDIASRARALREWFRGFVQKHKGKRLRSAALKELAPLNRLLERDQEYGQIVLRELHGGFVARSALAWRAERRWQGSDSLLFPIARSMADLVSNADFSCIKACEGPTCTLFFLDRTQGQAKRWCSMAVCGNRAKQAAHRKRERGR
jgi:predicted RNA-binding Zn ribbon-like protein